MSADGVQPAPTPEFAALDLEVAVREELDKSFDWTPLTTIATKLPPEQRDEDALEKLMFALADRGVVRLTIRPGKSLLISLVRPDYQPTAEVRPDPPPAPAKVKFVHATGDPEPLKHLAGRRFRVARPTDLSPAKPIKEPRMKSDDILPHLAKGPATTAQLAKAIGEEEHTVSYHLTNLLKRKVVHKPQGRMGPWALTPEKGAAVRPAPTPVARPNAPRPAAASKKSNGTAVSDLDLKLQTLEAHVDAAKAGNRPIAAFILTEIREDLLRLAKAA